MADVRLTATNPEDSSVVPVACDASGRLLLQDPEVVEGPQGPPGEQGPPGQDGQDGDPFSGNFAGDVTFGGSAEFAGRINFDGNWGSDNQAGIIGGNAGFTFRNDQEDVSGFQLFKDGFNEPNITAKITMDGSAEFAGGKAGFTAEGYLWCTTERGDTVMLQATVGGAGLWIDYTPTSRIDEIRDKLDAKRPDTGEMPADTP